MKFILNLSSFFILLLIIVLSCEKDLEPAIEVEFAADKTSITLGETVSYSDNSKGSPSSWEWEFEGGTPSTSTEQNPRIIYENIGTFEVKLKSSNSANSSELLISNYINVAYSPDSLINVAFSADTTNIYLGQEVVFSDSSKGNPSSWEWEFEGGTPSTSIEQNPRIIYESVGIFGVKLKSSNTINSGELLISNYINVNYSSDSLINVAFSADTTSIYLGQEVAFSDSSKGNPSSWEWEFEGGTPATSTEQNPKIIYENVGVFDVKLKSRNTINSNELLINNYINVNYSPDSLINVLFSADTTNIFLGQEVVFSDSSKGNPSSWEWEFEGGTPATSTEQNPRIIYENVGVFDVKLKANNLISSGELLISNYINVVYSPDSLINVKFSADTTHIFLGQEVAFSDSSKGNPSSWEWEFEGGTPATSTEQNPRIVYGNEGVFDVKLRANNSINSGDLLISKYIHVNTEPDSIVIANFYSNITQSFPNDPVLFWDSSKGKPTSWEWTFDGGTPSTSMDQNPVITYANTGTYNVILKASNKDHSDVMVKSGFIVINNTLAKGLIAHYKLDGNGIDATGNQIDGVLVESPTVVYGQNGNINSALEFTSGRQSVEIETDYELNNTVSVFNWVKLNAFTSPLSHYIFNVSDTISMLLRVPDGFRAGVRGINGVYLATGYSNYNYFEDGNWHFMGFTYDGADLKLYLDGNLVQTATGVVELPKVTTKGFIGNHFTEPRTPNATIDELRVYNRALSAAEVLELYNN